MLALVVSILLTLRVGNYFSLRGPYLRCVLYLRASACTIRLKIEEKIMNLRSFLLKKAQIFTCFFAWFWSKSCYLNSLNCTSQYKQVIGGPQWACGPDVAQAWFTHWGLVAKHQVRKNSSRLGVYNQGSTIWWRYDFMIFEFNSIFSQCQFSNQRDLSIFLTILSNFTF